MWVNNARGGNPIHPNNLLSLNRYGVSTDELGELLPLVNREGLYQALTRPGVRPSQVLDVWGNATSSYEDSESLIRNFIDREDY